jgi:hypothetical protein
MDMIEMDEATRMRLAARLTEIWRWRADESEAEFARRSNAEASALAAEVRTQHGQASLEILMDLVGRRMRAKAEQALDEAHTAMEDAMQAEAAYEEAVIEKPRHG